MGLDPHKCRIHDPWCGSDGMFVQSENKLVTITETVLQELAKTDSH